MSEAVELAILLSAKDAASETLGKVSEKFHGMGGAAQTAMVGFAAVAAVGVAVGGSLLEMANGAANAAMEVRKLARETGMTTEEASKLRYAGERLNIDTDALSKSLGKFSKSLESTHPALEKYGIDVVKTADGHISMEKTLDKIADRFKEMPDGVEKTAIAMDLFGKSGKDMIPLLNQGSEGLKEMGLDAQKMGLVFSKDGVDSAFKFGQAQKDLADRFEGVKNTIGLAVLPVLTKLIGVAVDIADVVMPKVLAIFGVAQTVFKAVGEIVDVFTGKNKAAGGELRSLIGNAAEPLMAVIARLREAWEKMVEKVMPIIAKLVAFIQDHMDTIQAVIKVAMDYISGILGAEWTAIVGIFDTFMLLLDGNWSGAWDKITETMRNLLVTIGGLALSLGEKIVSAILAGLGTLKTAAGNAIGSALRDAIDGIDFWVGPFHVTGRGGVAFSMPSFSMPTFTMPFGGDSGSSSFGGTSYESHEQGTPYVQRTGLALLHEGEAVITAAQNAGGGAGTGDIVLHTTLVMPDGAVLARTVERYNASDQRRRGLVAEPFGV